MQLTFKQKMSIILDNFDVYDEKGNIYFIVKGKFTWLTRQFEIYDCNNNLVGELKEEVSILLPCFTMIENGQTVGIIKKEMTFFKPKFTLSCSAWIIEGNWVERHYVISNYDEVVATIDRKLISMFDTYYLDITNEEDALKVLMVVLAIEIISLNGRRYNAIYNSNS